MAKTKVLYLSNIEVPYRTKFFNLLGEECDLTVLYERKQSSNRNKEWVKSEKSSYHKEYLGGINLGNERSFSLGVLRYVFADYDKIIVGCFNDPVQMLAIIAMRIARRKYYVNVDGKMFDSGSNLKRRLRKFFVKGAQGYFCAGEKVSSYLKDFIETDKPIYPYLLSSMDKSEVDGIKLPDFSERNNRILVVGQYEDYKGLDIAVNLAKDFQDISFTFVGMGRKQEEFDGLLRENGVINAESIAFLRKNDLYELYKTYGLLVLPSRQECWGLVINECAGFGMPIVSTFGSGAAEEFLSPKYENYLAIPGSIESLHECLERFLNAPFDEKEEYGKWLFEKSKKYYIEENVESFIQGLED